MTLATPLQDLVGPKTAQRLAAAGMHTLLDVLELVPQRWDDLRAPTCIADLVEGERQTVRATVTSGRLVKGARPFAEITLRDESGEMVAWWMFGAGGWLARLSVGSTWWLSGKVKRYGKRWRMVNPTVTQDGGEGAGVKAIYPVIDGVPRRQLEQLLAQALPLVSQVPDPVPAEVRARLGLMGRGEALAFLHGVSR